ncbi:MAG: hypothetical protein M1298_05005, partial [Chloroflexi bacterium]|nr:hypothetical protein [Chloroflexota bacterium]
IRESPALRPFVAPVSSRTGSGGLTEAPLDREVEWELAGYWRLREFIVERRLTNWRIIDRMARRLALNSALPLPSGAVPSIYLLATPRQFSTVAALRRRGIESGPAYGSGIVFVPCHPGVNAHWLREIAEGLAEGCQWRCRHAYPSMPSMREGSGTGSVVSI